MSLFKIIFHVAEALGSVGAAILAIKGNYESSQLALMFIAVSILSDLRASKEQE